MIVPEFWAESKDRIVTEEGTRTIRRFGWSDESQPAAQIHADERVAAAAAAMAGGESVLIREPKVAYNGADGLPICEEVVQRHDAGSPHEVVLTRNAYGAICLNTPDVLFADVDVSKDPGCSIYVVTFVLLFAGLFTLAIRLNIEDALWMVLFVSFLASGIVGSLIHKVVLWFRGSPKQHARRRIDGFANAHPNWSIRLYETPNGWRVLVTHQTFDPRGQEATGFFRAIGTDPIYARMCFNQNCFRARVTPKPWRINCERLRTGVWPIASERMPYRDSWVRNYEVQRLRYSACRFIETLGQTRMAGRCEEAEFVRKLHDEWCDCDSGKPIA